MDCQLCFQTHVFWHGHSSYWRGMGDGRSNNQIMLRGTRTSQWLLLIWRRVGWVWKRGKRPEQYGNDKSYLALYAVGKSFDTAGKGKTKETVRRYEAEYYEKVEAFTSDREKCSTNLARYLKAQAYQIPGNVAWSLRCPRYHPELCPEAQDALDAQAKQRRQCTEENFGSNKSSDAQEKYVLGLSENSDSETSQASSGGTPRSSLSSSSSVQSDDDSTDLSKFESRATLGDEVSSSLFFFFYLGKCECW